MSDLRTAAQQALDSINELFAAEQSEGGERGGHIRTPATREHLVRVAQARKALHESCDTLRAALAQAEPQGCATEEDCTKQPWCRIRGECQRKQAEPLNLSDPAVQKRLATQWGYVPAAQAEPVEPVAWVNQANLASARLTRDRGGQGDTHTWSETRSNYHGVPLYTAPPQRKPLTEQEIESCRQQGYAHAGFSAPFDFGKAARAVEKAVWEKNNGQA